MFINPVELYRIATISKYFNMGCMIFQSFCIQFQTIADMPTFQPTDYWDDMYEWRKNRGKSRETSQESWFRAWI
jgi:hypothetical protein